MLKTGAVYSRPCGDALLFLVSQLLARLLRSPGLPLTSVVDITSGWIFRLECEPSVPVILGLYPIIRAQLLSNAKSFLDASRERPVLNWILLAIARELHGDPSKSFLVDLATMMVSLFSHLIKIEGGVEVWWRLCGCGGVGQERDPVVVCCDGFADVLPENVGKFLEVCQSVVEGSCRLDGEDLVETSVGHGSEESEEGESCLYGKWQMQQVSQFSPSLVCEILGQLVLSKSWMCRPGMMFSCSFNKDDCSACHVKALSTWFTCLSLLIALHIAAISMAGFRLAVFFARKLTRDVAERCNRDSQFVIVTDNHVQKEDF